MSRTPLEAKREARRGTALALAGAGATLLTLSIVACGGGGGSSSPAAAPPPSVYQATLLVSDQAAVGAVTTDTHLVNPWGLAYGPTTSFWTANQGTSTTTVYDGLGHMPPTPIVVAVPPMAGHTMVGPTGVVFNGSAGFQADQFVIASLDGCLCGWSTGATMTRRVDNSASAIYTGLATGTSGAATYLYAANLAAGTVDVFDATYAPVNLGAGTLVDPTLPAGFSPYNVQILGGKLFVSYAKHDPAALRETPGAGLGYVSLFNLDGTFVRRVASGGALNAPWGMALAPSNFGPFSGALLVGNFGDGRVTAFDVTTGAQLGQLSGAGNAPLTISGLWALSFGNGTSAGLSNQLYFTAGPSAETHGLFGVISYGPSSAAGGGGVGGGY